MGQGKEKRGDRRGQRRKGVGKREDWRRVKRARMDGEMGRGKKEKRQKNGSRGNKKGREGKGENRVKTEVVKRKQGVYVYECVAGGTLCYI